MLETLAALSVTGQITWAICSFIVLIVIISILFRHTAHRRAKPAGPVISYYDETNADLKFIACQDIACSLSTFPRTLDDTGLVGKYTSITIETQGYPVISYYDESNTNLKLAYCRHAECIFTPFRRVLAPTGTSGNNTSISINGSGYPIVSYYDSIDGWLKMARCGNLDCVGFVVNPIRAIDPINDISMTLGTDGLPLIAYTSASGIYVVKCHDMLCSSSSQNAVYIISITYDVSLTIGTNGLPVIAYSTAGNVRVANCNDTVCSSSSHRILATRANPDPSLTIGFDGLPFISYFGGIYGLEVAKCANTFCIDNWTRR